VASARFATVEEAADVLGIGRTAAYAAAKKWRVTGGAGGLKVVAIGGSLRVPTPWLEELAGGPIDLDEIRAERAARHVDAETVDAEASPPVLEVITDPEATPAPKPTSTRARATRPTPQLDLFDPPSAS
jgi:hypothetical protein